MVYCRSKTDTLHHSRRKVQCEVVVYSKAMYTGRRGMLQIYMLMRRDSSRHKRRSTRVIRDLDDSVTKERKVIHKSIELAHRALALYRVKCGFCFERSLRGRLVFGQAVLETETEACSLASWKSFWMLNV